jgi:redox-sensing transcriptional repressor
MRVSQKAITRLSQYRDILHRFKEYGSQWIYSCDLAAAMGSTAAQVRKDFSIFAIPGKKKVGYEIDTLIKHINTHLQKDSQHTAILAGLSLSGVSLIKEQLLAAQGISIAAAFDAGTAKAAAKSSLAGVPVMPLDKMIEFVTTHSIKLGIIAATDGSAQRILDLMAMAGIRGVLNLAPTDLKSPRNCVVNSVNLVREFEKMVYFAAQPDGGPQGA